jgi:transcriptional regulator with XRE-family HTH domain
VTTPDREGGPATPVLGAYLRAQRKLADLSLRQLAEMAQVSNAYLSQIERGLHQPSVKVLRSIADALKLPGESLLVEAGLIDVASGPPVTGTEAAIMADPELTAQDKAVLVALYRNLRQRQSTSA